MKHIFTIHSHITFLAALAAIKYNNIPTDDVILICNAGYSPKVHDLFKGTIIQSFDEMESRNKSILRLIPLSYAKRLRRYTKEITGGEQYIAYIDIMSVFNRSLVLEENCVKFNIIEEGIVNYGDFDDFRMFTMDLDGMDWSWTHAQQWKQVVNGIIRLLKGRSLRMLALPIHPNAYINFKDVQLFTFSDHAFLNARSSHKVILKWEDTLDWLDESIIPDYSDKNLWIGDSVCRFYSVDLKDYEHSLNKVLENENPTKERREIWIKYKGAESKKEVAITENIFSLYNYDIKYLHKNDIMELGFLKSKNLTVFGNGSSLLIYANLMGHRVVSIFKYIPDKYNIPLYTTYQSISEKVGFI